MTTRENAMPAREGNAPAAPQPAGLPGRLMPAGVTGWTRAMARASLLANAALIVTGGAVRLSGSGLGCPDWPRCDGASWTSTPEMGVHGIIEFGNRTLTFVLVIIAVATTAALWRARARHRLPFALSIVLCLGIVVQAVTGGITVRTGLNPWIVGIHFNISAVLVAVAAVLSERTRRASLPAVAAAARPGQLGGLRRVQARSLAVIIAVSAAAAIYLGTLVTGTGPHSGDAGVLARHAFDPHVIARVHAIPVYLLSAAVLIALVRSLTGGWPVAVRARLAALAVLVLSQAALGYYQWFNGVPALAVMAHLTGAAVLAALTAATADRIWAVSAHPAPQAGTVLP